MTKRDKIIIYMQLGGEPYTFIRMNIALFSSDKHENIRVKVYF